MPIQVRILWFAVMPLLTPLFGYFPGKRLRVVGDLPANVAWQWRRWCLHPEYLLVEGGAREAFARVAAPILAYSVEDDSLITQPAVDALHAAFRGARVERRHVVPAQLGVERVGHFGFFSEAREASLWADSLEWLRGRVAAS
jgi:predicted alpha/beta hydrolase